VAGLPFLVREVERSIPGWSALRDWVLSSYEGELYVPLHVTTILLTFSFCFYNKIKFSFLLP
jgi:hypothetical protein